MRALAIAATGMAAQQLNVEVISHNVANINTTAFKRSRAEFSDLLYQVEREAGTPTSNGTEIVPEGLRVGLGVRPAAIRNLHLQGALTQTGNTLDLALMGKGYFQISGPDNETLYTRAGAFNKNASGQLVTTDGYLVQPTITIPTEVTAVTVNESGQVLGQVPGQTDPQLLGQLSIASFVNDVGLSPLGGNLYRETSSSGPATIGIAGTSGLGAIKQGYLESSNVDAVKEITELISAQRAYEMNSKVIQAADEMMGTIAKGLR
ncbi:MAG: flagellar basal-body rod protein FlgG [Hyphomicrobiaceae bacterium]|uniref:flagellar basal-body rod protein FlgG n=1 Tax=Pseudorhodoplanes sp. TaxID=1934341 RepID=UPI003D125C66